MDSAFAVPDTITITEYHYLDIKSGGADVECTVSSTMSRGAVPPIIGRLRDSLRDIGISDDALSISNLNRNHEVFGCIAALATGITVIAGLAANPGELVKTLATVLACSSFIVGLAWIFGRTTNCSFKIRCNNNETVARIHGLLKEKFEQITILSTSWRYDVQSDALADWADKCIERANSRAQRVAKSLGVQIVGVFSYEEKHELPRRHYTPEILREPTMVAGSGRRKSIGANAMEESFEKSDSSIFGGGEERAGAHIRIQYRVANYVPKA